MTHFMIKIQSRAYGLTELSPYFPLGTVIKSIRIRQRQKCSGKERRTTLFHPISPLIVYSSHSQQLPWLSEQQQELYTLSLRTKRIQIILLLPYRSPSLRLLNEKQFKLCT